MDQIIFKNSLVIVMLATVSGAPAFADSMDYFFHVTPSRQSAAAPFPKFPLFGSAEKSKTQQPAPPPKSQASNVLPDRGPPKQQALVWFENFDDIVFTMGASDHEKYILKRPINQEAERLREWIAANNSLARKYRLMARKIRESKPSKSIADLTELQSEAADWYDDNAQLCEELTATRPPAKTYEELERAYRNFITRSNNLAQVSNAITELSTKLRQKYDVHQPKYTDEAAKYVDSVAHQIREK